MEINGTIISEDSRPYFIAEISGNHLHSLDRAIKMIKVAKNAGASAIKIQTIDPTKITIDTDDPRFIVNAGPWKGRKLADIYRETMLPKEWHKRIFSEAKALGIESFSAPFDKDAVDFLERLNVPAYKVASNEILDWPMLERICKTKKPIIISTGTATKKLINDTQDFLIANNCKSYAFMYCVSAYPPDFKTINLKTIRDMRKTYNVPIGFSDHTLGIEASISAVTLGASILEKHFTLDRNDGGSDSHFSLEPEELELLITSVNNVWDGLQGESRYPGERDLVKDGIFTRQLWSKQDIAAGQRLSWDNVISVRAPSNSGAMASFKYRAVIGKKTNMLIKKHEPIMESALKSTTKQVG